MSSAILRLHATGRASKKTTGCHFLDMDLMKSSDCKISWCIWGQEWVVLAGRFAFSTTVIGMRGSLSKLQSMECVLMLCDMAVGSSDLSSLVVMSKGTKYTQQSYKVADMFPFEWIKKKWREGFQITSLASGGGDKSPQWAVVMSRTSGFTDQCIELDFQYPSEGIHRRWDAGANLKLFLRLFACLP